MFKNESGDERYYAILNPAGNIAIHSYDDNCDYLLWEDGKIEEGDSVNPERTVDKLTAEKLSVIVQEIDGLEEEKMEHPE